MGPVVEKLQKLWTETAASLRDARDALQDSANTRRGALELGDSLEKALREFEDYLSSNELELAWDALTNAGEQGSAPAVFWQKLARAARLMGAGEKESAALLRAQAQVTSDQALRIAEADAERAYKDLSGYRVVLALEPDGWHVDYELKNGLSQGGGPHYVIDLTSGGILKKRYEQ